MKELLLKKQEAFDKHLYHQELAAKHESLARKWRSEELDTNEAIRSLERELSEGVKVVYGKELEGVVNIYR